MTHVIHTNPQLFYFKCFG